MNLSQLYQEKNMLQDNVVWILPYLKKALAGGAILPSYKMV